MSTAKQLNSRASIQDRSLPASSRRTPDSRSPAEACWQFRIHEESKGSEIPPFSILTSLRLSPRPWRDLGLPAPAHASFRGPSAPNFQAAPPPHRSSQRTPLPVVLAPRKAPAAFGGAGRLRFTSVRSPVAAIAFSAGSTTATGSINEERGATIVDCHLRRPLGAIWESSIATDQL